VSAARVFIGPFLFELCVGHGRGVMAGGGRATERRAECL
jgi:hypothetical protein